MRTLTYIARGLRALADRLAPPEAPLLPAVVHCTGVVVLPQDADGHPAIAMTDGVFIARGKLCRELAVVLADQLWDVAMGRPNGRRVEPSRN
jgi:hypothetical protein